MSCGRDQQSISKDGGEQCPCVDHCPVGWRAQSNMCLNSGTPETPDDARERRTVVTKQNESYPGFKPRFL